MRFNDVKTVAKKQTQPETRPNYDFSKEGLLDEIRDIQRQWSYERLLWFKNRLEAFDSVEKTLSS